MTVNHSQYHMPQPPTFAWADMSPEAQAAAKAGARSYNKLRTTSLDREAWKIIVRGIGFIRAEALRLNGLGPTDINHHVYKKTFQHLMQLPQAGSFSAFFGRGTKALRSHCLWWSERIETIDEWLAGLDEKERMRYNHPTTIWRHHPDGQRRPEPEPLIDPQTGEEITESRPSRQTRERDNHAVVMGENTRLNEMLQEQQRDPVGASRALLDDLITRDPVSGPAAVAEFLQQPRVAELEARIAELEAKNAQLRAENAQLRAELEAENAQLRARIDELEATVAAASPVQPQRRQRRQRQPTETADA